MGLIMVIPKPSWAGIVPIVLELTGVHQELVLQGLVVPIGMVQKPDLST